MNIYNFVYCFFYKFWAKRGNDGRIVGSAHVLFAILMHYLLLAEIILRTTGITIFSLPNHGHYGANRTMYFIFILPIWILIGLFFNRNRTNRLLMDFNKTYTNQRRNRIKAVTIFVLPMIVVVLLAVLRQRSLI